MCPKTETICVVTVVPSSAPSIRPTATLILSMPAETRVIVIESRAPLLCIRAVPNQPTRTPVVVSFTKPKKL